MPNTLLLSAVVERDLRAALADSGAITSPECLKASIMRARFVEHFAEVLLTQCREVLQTQDPTGHALFLAGHYFNEAVDRIYS